MYRQRCIQRVVSHCEMHQTLSIVTNVERSLQLTALCLRLNPANYTVWHFRRQCLDALDRHSDAQAIQKDLDLASSLGGDNPKNVRCTMCSSIRRMHSQFLLPTHYGTFDDSSYSTCTALQCIFSIKFGIIVEPYWRRVHPSKSFSKAN
jgi:hypothetical protein